MKVASQDNTELLNHFKNSFFMQSKNSCFCGFRSQMEKMCIENEANWKMLMNYKYFFNYFVIHNN